MTSIINRLGETVDFDIYKIKNVVEFCSKGLDVNPLELESHMSCRIKDGLTTREIQENLIQGALALCDIDNPDWRYVAGKLLIWGLREDVKAARGFAYDAESFIDYLRNNDRYDLRINLFYSKEELIEAYSFINPRLDFDYDYAGASLLQQRYLFGNELPQETYLLISLLLGLVENEPDRMRFVKEFYDSVSQRKVSFATPILANLRVEGGSGTSCFITTISDNLESIYDEIKNVALISKKGGGVGVNVSRIRAKGSTVDGRVNASGGVVPWIKVINDTVVAVNQG